MKKIIYLFIVGQFLITSCNEKSNKQNQTDITANTKDTITNKTDLPNNEKKEEFEFVNYDDNGDYRQLNVKNGDNIRSFINEKSEDRSFCRGDIIELTWKSDTIRIAGDGEREENAESIILAKKIKDGNVSKFRKKYAKEIKYTWTKENEYSSDYLDQLYKMVEYYLANSKNDLINQDIANRSGLTYSVEQQKRDNKDYTVLGIATEFEHHTSIAQWLYYDNEQQKLYEYDLPNDKLIEFK